MPLRGIAQPQIAERLRPLLDDARLERLDVIPGVNRTTIENVMER
jgi:hypothetical protein